MMLAGEVYPKNQVTAQKKDNMTAINVEQLCIRIP